MNHHNNVGNHMTRSRLKHTGNTGGTPNFNDVRRHTYDDDHSVKEKPSYGRVVIDTTRRVGGAS
jgi:hypothetical protein